MPGSRRRSVGPGTSSSQHVPPLGMSRGRPLQRFCIALNGSGHAAPAALHRLNGSGQAAPAALHCSNRLETGCSGGVALLKRVEIGCSGGFALLERVGTGFPSSSRLLHWPRTPCPIVIRAFCGRPRERELARGGALRIDKQGSRVRFSRRRPRRGQFQAAQFLEHWCPWMSRG